MRESFYPFQLERNMSIWQNMVDYDLSNSGVGTLTVNDLLEQDPASITDFLSTGLGYPHTNGSTKLRMRIAALYPGANLDNVVVTTGAAQANFTTILTFMDPGDEILVMLPNYNQIWGIAKNYSLKVKTFSLYEDFNWALDPDELRHQVTEKTRLIAICNPNNPTGHILSSEERQAIVETANSVGAWILADEVYTGSEHGNTDITPSFWNEYDKTFAIGGMSKAYGLPGLRIGWVLAQKEMAEKIWARQDYITLIATSLGNELATYALSPERRSSLINRVQTNIHQGYRNFKAWCEQNQGLISHVPPQAAAFAFVRYLKDINSTELVNRLIHNQRTYVVPGDHFGLDQHLRIGFGQSTAYVNEGLRRIADELSLL
jgi:aspartate/methionine/tyrosine aminotransferase